MHLGLDTGNYMLGVCGCELTQIDLLLVCPTLQTRSWLFCNEGSTLSLELAVETEHPLDNSRLLEYVEIVG